MFKWTLVQEMNRMNTINLNKVDLNNNNIKNH